MSLRARQRENRACGRAADARQRLHCFDRLRKFAAVLGDDELRGAMQIARTRVVAEAGPQVQHFIDGRGSERAHVGKALHEALVVAEHGRDLRLLQHDLRHPHAIRRRVLLPRQMLAAGAIEPGEERRARCPGHPGQLR